MYVVNSFNVCGKSVSVFSTSTVYTVNPRFAFIRGGRFILSVAIDCKHSAMMKQSV